MENKVPSPTYCARGAQLAALVATFSVAGGAAAAEATRFKLGTFEKDGRRFVGVVVGVPESPHAASPSVNAAAPTIASTFIPRAARKMISVHIIAATSAAMPRRERTPVVFSSASTVNGCAAALSARDPSVSRTPDEDHDDRIRLICRQNGGLRTKTPRLRHWRASGRSRLGSARC